MPRNREVVLTPAPLPANVAALEAQVRVKKVPSLIDICFDIIGELYEKPEFQQYFHAGWNVQAVTGNVKLDRFKATLMVIDHAKRNGINKILNAKEGKVHKAMNRAAWRYKIAIKDRRASANGHPTNGHDTETTNGGPAA